MTPEQRLEKMGLKLPEVPVPVANYVPWRFAGNLLLLKEVQLITFAPFAIVISVTASKRKKENGT